MEKSTAQTKLIMAIVMIASFITPFMANAINIAIPAIGAEFAGGLSLLNWVVSGFLLSSAAFLLPFGRLADLFGRKKIFLIGMFFLAAASLGCALAPSLIFLVIFRILQGIASAMIFSTAMAILTSVVPPQSRGKALGLNSAATYIGLSSGPVLGGLITSALSWRGIFYFNFLLAAIVIVLTLWKLKGEWTGAAGSIDGWGAVLCVAAQALLLFGLSDLTAGFLYQACFIAGVVLLAAFIVYEKRYRSPLIPVAAIAQNKPFAFANLATLINYSATFALAYVMSLYLQTALGIDTAVSGLVLLVQPVIMAILSPVTGMLSDKIRPAILASLGMGISALGLFFFIFLSTQTPLALIVVNLAFIGLGFALFASPNTNAVMGSVDKTLYGVASSLMGNMRLLGQSVSMAIVALITSVIMRGLSIGSPGYVAQLMVSFKIAFIIFSVLCVLGVFASMVRGKAAGGVKLEKQ
jgi:EmrB/QacA subfamily drug resistance transporter